MTSKRTLHAGAAIGIALLISACFTTAREIQAGAGAAREVEAAMGLVDEPELSAYLRRIGARLARHSPRQELEYRFFVVDRPEPNAFALPGGWIYVSRGLLALLNSEDELACVIGHEIGHVAAKHHAKQARRGVVFLPARIVAGLGGAAASIVSPMLGRTLTGLVDLPAALTLAAYSREQEREADTLGQSFAADEGWDPAGMASVMDALGREETLHGADPGRLAWLASHPTSEERRRDAQQRAGLLPRAKAQLIAATRSAYLKRLDGLLVGPSGAEGVFVDSRFLHLDLDFSVQFPKGWKTANGQTVVGAADAEGKAAALLQVAQGSDAAEAAEAFANQSGARYEQAPAEVGLGAGRGLRAEARASGGRRVHLTWVGHGEHVFMLAGIALERDFEALRPRFDAFAASFRGLRSSEHALVTESRLRIVKAGAGDTIETLVERRGSSWSTDEALIANGFEKDGALESGTAIKLALPEPYVPKTP